MPSVLDRIIAHKQQEIREAMQVRPAERLRAELKSAPPVRDFFAPLAAGGPIKLIAEVKKASPSKGVIRHDFDPVEAATIYEEHGATCISVLTDSKFFQGHLDYLRQIRDRVQLPLLRKDFVLDSYQLLEARCAGADAVLLIAECLDTDSLQRLHDESIELGMAPLVEFYDPENLSRVLDAGARLVGINNRNLHTFETDLEHTVRLRAKISPEVVVVGESGIHCREDVLRLQQSGVNAILVGEHFMASPEIGAAVDAVLGQTAGVKRRSSS